MLALPIEAELRARRLPWAKLLRRAFGDDLLKCPCGGRREVVAPPRQDSFELPVDDGAGDPSSPD